MSAVSTPPAAKGQAAATARGDVTEHGRRLSTETKAAFKTTEFVAYVALLVGIFVAGAVTSGGVGSAGVHHADVFPAHQVWLYAAVVTVGYMVSRGLAKAGSRQPYDEKS